MVSSTSTDDPEDVSLHRSRLRLRGVQRKAQVRRVRSTRAVLSMVDLLSCAFGGALFLFMLTAAPPNQAGGLPPTVFDRATLWIDVETTNARPIVILKRYETAERRGPAAATMRIDLAQLDGSSALRKVIGATSNDFGGNVYAFGPTPWESAPGTRPVPLILMLDDPATHWCVRLGMASDDTLGRSGVPIAVGAITVRRQLPEGATPEDAFDPTATIPTFTKVGLDEQCLAFTLR